MADFGTMDIAKVAILVADETGELRRDTAAFRQIEDEFMHHLIPKGYSVAARSDIEAVRQELKLQQSGWTDPADAAAIGRMLNVPAVIIVVVTELRTSSHETGFVVNNRRVENHFSHARLSARLIGTERADVLWIGSHAKAVSINDPRREQSAALRPTANELASSFPRRGSAAEAPPSVSMGVTSATSNHGVWQQSPFDQMLSQVPESIEFDAHSQSFTEGFERVWTELNHVLQDRKESVFQADEALGTIVTNTIHSGLFRDHRRYYIWVERVTLQQTAVHMKLLRYGAGIETGTMYANPDGANTKIKDMYERLDKRLSTS